MKKILWLILICPTAWAQQLAPLTVEKIMRDPKWMGIAPSNISWAEDGKQIYFNWNPDRNPEDSLYSISLANRAPQKVNASIRRALPASFNSEYNKLFTKKLYEKNGDLFLLDVATARTTQITNTLDRESNPTFSQDEKKILFTADGNLFNWEISTGAFTQLTNFKKGNKRPEAKQSPQEKWLKDDQLAYFEILKQRSDSRKATEKNRKADQPIRPKEIYLDDKNVDNIQLSPDGNLSPIALQKTQMEKTLSCLVM